MTCEQRRAIMQVLLTDGTGEWGKKGLLRALAELKSGMPQRYKFLAAQLRADRLTITNDKRGRAIAETLDYLAGRMMVYGEHLSYYLPQSISEKAEAIIGAAMARDLRNSTDTFDPQIEREEEWEGEARDKDVSKVGIDPNRRKGDLTLTLEQRRAQQTWGADYFSGCDAEVMDEVIGRFNENTRREHGGKDCGRGASVTKRTKTQVKQNQKEGATENVPYPKGHDEQGYSPWDGARLEKDHPEWSAEKAAEAEREAAIISEQMKRALAEADLTERLDEAFPSHRPNAEQKALRTRVRKAWLPIWNDGHNVKWMAEALSGLLTDPPKLGSLERKLERLFEETRPRDPQHEVHDRQMTPGELEEARVQKEQRAAEAGLREWVKRGVKYAPGP